MDENTQMAATAASHFANREYDRSHQLFNELKQKTNNNSKEILMNLAIVEYYQGNCSNPTKLLEVLNQLYKSTVASTTSSTSSNNATSSPPSDGQSSPTLVSSASPTSPSLTSSPTSGTSSSLINDGISLDNTHSGGSSSSSNNNNNNNALDNDQALLIYNQAVLNYSLKQYGTSYQLLDLAYQNILFLDDYLAIRICFLLVNISITVAMYERAYKVLVYLEQNYSHLYYTHKGDSSKESKSPTDNNNNSNNNNNISQTNSNDELSSSTTDQINSQTSSTWSSTMMTPIEFKFMIHFYKAKLYILSNLKENYSLAKDEIKNAMSRAVKIDYNLLPSCYLLKSNYYNITGNAQKSLQFLNQSKDNNSNQSKQNQETQSELPPVKPLSFGMDIFIEDITPQIYFNNLGCLHFNLNKYTSSLFYFTKSLKSINIDSQNNNNQNNQNNNNNSTHIFYNTGVLLLLTGKPELAFSCLQEACLLLYNNPLVWLRIAECCIFSHVLKCKEDDKATNCIHLIDNSSSSGGNGDSRRVVLPTSSGLHKGLQIEDSDVQSTLVDESDSDSSRLGTLSLDFASKCLRNAHYLHKKQLANQGNNNKSNSSTSSSKSQPNKQGNQNNVNSPIQQHPPNELYNLNSSSELMMSILTSQAYISLCLSNPIVALTYCKELLSLCDSCSSNSGNNNTNSGNQNSNNNNITNNNNNNGGQPSQSSNQTLNIEKYRYYAHIYAAEASIMLNVPEEAIKYLSPQFIESVRSLESTSHQQHKNGSTPSMQGSDYRCIFYTNLAIAYLLQNDMMGAQQCIATLVNEKNQQQLQQHQLHQQSQQQQSISSQTPPAPAPTQIQSPQPMTEFDSKLILLQIYVELRSGRLANAKSIISNQRPIPIILSPQQQS